MILAKVVGNLWATRKDEKLNGLKLMVCQRRLQEEVYDDKLIVAADNAGAGVGDHVLITTGSSARISFARDNIPADMVIVGIIDKVDFAE
ncbi:ethanolamine utilization protein EutN [Suicoccus acidiformans]|uniref:Ethanolamine utilization protein EutN n=1 Tax=Suicoccus acidiformans TaxID=2036206 RepID=A0A347WLY3_9LACT|nr:EutN/CcmL family microcompartment protein [Suicoccus acidiformans]AXY26090.1 ethanolamine utilization protein EutN [Suicoccus acidiformans]